MSEPLLRVRQLVTKYDLAPPERFALDGVSFELGENACVAVIGESGAGKTSLGLSLMRLIPKSVGRVDGEVLLDGADMLAMPERAMHRLRGTKIGMVFQEAGTGLSPVSTVGTQLLDAFARAGIKGRNAKQRAETLLDELAVPGPNGTLRRHAHELSSGVRQRVLLALALACRPKLLIVDDPTAHVDALVQAQVVDAIERHRKEVSGTTLYLTSDLSVVAEVASEVIVLYAGRIVESGSTREVLEEPLHPYTRGLVESWRLARVSSRRFETLGGSFDGRARGCRFFERCVRRRESEDRSARCGEREPPVEVAGPGRRVRCFYAERAS